MDTMASFLVGLGPPMFFELFLFWLNSFTTSGFLKVEKVSFLGMPILVGELLSSFLRLNEIMCFFFTPWLVFEVSISID